MQEAPAVNGWAMSQLRPGRVQVLTGGGRQVWTGWLWRAGSSRLIAPGGPGEKINADGLSKGPIAVLGGADDCRVTFDHGIARIAPCHRDGEAPRARSSASLVVPRPSLTLVLVVVILAWKAGGRLGP